MMHFSHVSLKHALLPVCRLAFGFRVSVPGRRTGIRDRPDYALLVGA
jgi:hypothetical protein